MGYSPPYYLRLRIYARQAAYFYRKLRELDPVFDNCPVRCLAPNKDKANGCPDCDYTVNYNLFRANYYKHLKKDLREGFLRYLSSRDAEEETEKASLLWTFETLAEDYRNLCSLEEIAGAETEEQAGGHNPAWNIRTDLAIAIIREERYKVRREFAHKRKLELEALARGNGVKK